MDNFPAINWTNFCMQVSFWLSQPINYWNFFSRNNLSTQTVFAYHIKSFFASLMSHQYQIIVIKEKPEICCFSIISFFATLWSYHCLFFLLQKQSNELVKQFGFTFTIIYGWAVVCPNRRHRQMRKHLHPFWSPNESRGCYCYTWSKIPFLHSCEIKQKLYLLAPVWGTPVKLALVMYIHAAQNFIFTRSDRNAKSGIFCTVWLRTFLFTCQFKWNRKSIQLFLMYISHTSIIELHVSTQPTHLTP